ncbi:MAG: META domain-containing protein [Chitinophagales bacterium]|nr:META domain-containing protein [Chitinophagales bacterium]
MKKQFIILMFASFLFTACSTTKNSVFWVSGMKTECANGAGKTTCLNVSKSDNLEDAKWETFYAPIEGFTFEEGYLKKIKVKEEKLDANKIPQDVSSIKYTLVTELDKQVDQRALAHGDWLLAKINAGPVNKMVKLPTLNVDVLQNRISGNNGCNNYTATIKNINQTELQLSVIASTKKMCVDMTFPNEFDKVLATVTAYKVEDDKLTLMNSNNEAVLMFIKGAPKAEADYKLNDIWSAIRIDGGKLDKSVAIPSLEINLSTMKIMGSDGCNNYSGNIESIDDKNIALGNTVSTLKACIGKNVADKYNSALSKIASYKLDGLILQFFDSNGNEVLAFLKAD